MKYISGMGTVIRKNKRFFEKGPACKNILLAKVRIELRMFLG
jgi:hypothetical protein